MRHLKKGKKFGRETGPRKALLKSLLHNLITCDKIKTTESKAKELKPMIEKMVTRAKDPTIANKRLIMQRLGNVLDVKKLFSEIAPKYKERKGGYTRIIKIAPRKSDAAKMAVIEFI